MGNYGNKRKIKILSIILIVISLGYGKILWASDMQVKVSMGINGDCKWQSYIPVTVTIENGDNDFTGKIQIIPNGSNVEYTETINLAKNVTKKVIIPIHMFQNDTNTAKVSILDEKGKEVFSKKVLVTNYISDQQIVVGLLTDDVDRLNYLNDIDLYGNQIGTYSLKMDLSMIDEKPKNLDMLDVMVINDYNTSNLLPEQLSSIESWVAQGGTLVIGTGANANKTLSGFSKEFMPIEVNGSQIQTIEILGEEVSSELVNLKVLDEKDKVDEKSFSELYKSIAIGSGKVLVMRYDLGLEPMGSFKQNNALWKQILSNELTDLSQQETYINSHFISRMLGSIKSDKLPNAIVIGSLLLGYIVGMGIVTYFVLKKKGKKEYIWVVAPTLAIGLTVMIYLMSVPSRLEAFVTNQLDIIRVDNEGNASKVSHVNILNTQGKDLELIAPENITFELVGSIGEDRYYQENTNTKITEHLSYEGEKATYRKTDCRVYDSTLAITSSQPTQKPNYINKLMLDDTDYKVYFKNKSNQKIKKLYVLWEDGIWDLGELDIDADITYKLSSLNRKVWHQFLSELEIKNQEQDLASILRVIEAYEMSKYYTMPVYIAITKGVENELELVKGKYTTDFNYCATLEEMNVTSNGEGRIVYPYNYFAPVIESQSGTGYVDTYAPIMVVNENIEVVLDYPINTDCHIEEIIIGLNEDVMMEYYYTLLNGKVFLYNYETNSYEEINPEEEHKITGDSISAYAKDNRMKLKIIGMNEDSGLVPSIKVGGTSHATN